jgi:hypothetical protein
VNKATFRLAVEALYRILEDYEILEGVLGMATNQASWMTAADVYGTEAETDGDRAGIWRIPNRSELSTSTTERVIR